MPYLPNGEYLPATNEEYLVTLPPDLIHTDEHPFCDDPTCPCHEDADLISPVNDAYQEGLLSAGDATTITKGKRL